MKIDYEKNIKYKKLKLTFAAQSGFMAIGIMNLNERNDINVVLSVLCFHFGISYGRK